LEKKYIAHTLYDPLIIRGLVQKEGRQNCVKAPPNLKGNARILGRLV